MQNLPLEMKIGFREFGMQEARLSKFTMRTRILKDLRIFGDEFDRLFVRLGGIIPFFDRYIETPDVTLGAIHNHLRG